MTSLPALEKELHGGIRLREYTCSAGHRVRTGRVLQLEVIINQNTGQHDFRLVDCEKAARAGLSAVTIDQVIRSCSHSL
jgi:hypothetical protein